jgi:hypothetical protein
MGKYLKNSPPLEGCPKDGVVICLDEREKGERDERRKTNLIST